jgi:bifunctional NMN adenylyltransferase/nudix hydrolase
MSTHKVAVVYAPFQVSSVVGDRLKRSELDFYDSLIIVLPEKRFPNSKSSPLDFDTRRSMLEEQVPWAKILKLPDEKDGNMFVERLQSIVREKMQDIIASTPFLVGEIEYTLYTAESTGIRYTSSGGQWPVENFPVEWEATQRKTVVRPLESEDFRAGVIYALNKRFPISWLTVDMAILRREAGKTFILLGKKPGEQRWRFPGGFKDRNDLEIEMSVRREGMEEAIGNIKEDGSKYFEYPKYLGSRNINDWRYAGDEDGITTVFYEMLFIGDLAAVKAGDDLAEVGWFDISQVTDEMFVGEHRHLWKLFMERHR